MSDVEYQAAAAEILAALGNRPLLVFGYGSLLWKPGFDYARRWPAHSFGWHRSFCLRLSRWRGSDEQPGLMMALEPGGMCRGELFGVAPGAEREQLDKLWATPRICRYFAGLEMLKVFEGRTVVYRKFKPPFSPCATIPPARQAVNRAVFAENSPSRVASLGPASARIASRLGTPTAWRKRGPGRIVSPVAEIVSPVAEPFLPQGSGRLEEGQRPSRGA